MLILLMRRTVLPCIRVRWPTEEVIGPFWCSFVPKVLCHWCRVLYTLLGCLSPDKTWQRVLTSFVFWGLSFVLFFVGFCGLFCVNFGHPVPSRVLRDVPFHQRPWTFPYSRVSGSVDLWTLPDSRRGVFCCLTYCVYKIRWHETNFFLICLVLEFCSYYYEFLPSVIILLYLILYYVLSSSL